MMPSPWGSGMPRQHFFAHASPQPCKVLVRDDGFNLYLYRTPFRTAAQRCDRSVLGARIRLSGVTPDHVVLKGPSGPDRPPCRLPPFSSAFTITTYRHLPGSSP